MTQPLGFSAPAFPLCAGESDEDVQVIDGELIPHPPAPLHTSATALAPALKHLPRLKLCTFLGQPVSEGALQQLPPCMRRLMVHRRAHTGPINLAALPALTALQLPDLQPDDTLPPSILHLQLTGRRDHSVSLEPILHLTQLTTLDLLLCLPKWGQLAELRSKVPSLQNLYLSMGVCPGPGKPRLAFPKLDVECQSVVR